MSEYLLVSDTNGIAAITFNRPEKRNAMNQHFIRELRHELNLLAQNDNVRVVLIHGNGEHFCAGADIAWMKEIGTLSEDQNYDDAQSLADLMYQLYSFPKPTIVLAHGATLGGGLGLLAACDIAIAAEDSSFGFSEVKIGITPSTISPYVITAIGERAAHYYFLTGERFNAEEARRLGLVHQVAQTDALMSVGLSIAQNLIQNSPQALKAAKQLIRYVSKEKISERLAQMTAEHLAQLRMTEEAQEGLQAFLEKRPAKWV